MSPRDRCREFASPLAVLLGFVALAGGASVGDCGRLQRFYVRDDIHDWVGREAAVRAGAPISAGRLTEDERTLRDLAFPLIEPPYDRPRWNAVVYEYGLDHSFRRELWIDDPTIYYAHLHGKFYRSSAARYNHLMDDIRNDIEQEPAAADADRVLTQLQQKVAINNLVAAPHFAEGPGVIVARAAPLGK